jgi:hypothetical protein
VLVSLYLSGTWVIFGCGILVSLGGCCNISGVKHALGIANHEYEYHLAFIITCDINKTMV